MPKTSEAVANPAAVTAYIVQLDPAKAELVEAIRTAILSSSKLIGEHIKWNAPAFFYSGPMQPFDPKEYKRDMIVMNLRQKDHVLLILPGGEKIKDVSTILEGDYTDGRRMIRIQDLNDLAAKKKDIKKVITAWIEMVE